MLISRISDETEGAGEGNGIEVDRVSSQEYQTASELFDLMTKNCHFDDNGEPTEKVMRFRNIVFHISYLSGSHSHSTKASFSFGLDAAVSPIVIDHLMRRF